MIVENPTPHLINNNIISVLESYFAFKLPKSYKEFLLKTNGGSPIKNYFIVKSTKKLGIVKYFLGILPEYSKGLLEKKAMFNGRIPINTLAIASDPGGDLILLSVRGADYGKVYYWDHELETEPADYSNLSLIADSFDEFINNLKSDEEIE